MRPWLATLLLAVLLLTGCTGTAKAPAPPPAPPTPPPAAPTAPPAPPAPPVGLDALLTPTTAAPLKRVLVKPGEPIDRSGLFFMNVATSAVEGWVMGDDPNTFVVPSFSSADHRWVQAVGEKSVYLADRQTATVYQWQPGAKNLLAARGDVLLVQADGRLWLVRVERQQATALDLPPASMVAAEIAPDGQSLLLIGDLQVYRVETASGQVERVGKIDLPAGAAPMSVGTLPGAPDTGVIFRAIFQPKSPPQEPLPQVTQRYSWAGRLLATQTTPQDAYFSPDGQLVAWDDRVLGLSHALVVGGTDLEPRVRLRGEAICNLPFQGPYWLPDSSGLMVNTTRGPRRLQVDGTLAELPPGLTLNGRQLPAPAPKPDLYAVGGITVVDGSGKQLAAAVPASAGHWFGVRDWYGVQGDPWGDRSDEVRFLLNAGGKGVSCDPPIFPPVVDRAPFPAISGLAVNVAGNDCVNLRAATRKDAPVIACLPNGTRLRAAQPPGTNNKGELQRWGNPLADNMGGDWWWYVRTDQGQRGWVYLAADYLTWDLAKPGEPTPDLLLLQVNDELANLRFWLQVAVGETPCGGNCYPGPSQTDSISGLLDWCREGPALLRATPGFDPARHGPGVSALANTCSGLQGAVKTLGPQDEGAAWRAKVQELLAALPK